jgi:hypothetical protein
MNESHALIEEEESARSDRRVWKRHVGMGSTRLTLKAMGVLYDAGAPLSRAEIIERLVPLLDPYERGYLEARYLRWCEKHRKHNRRRRKQNDDAEADSSASSSVGLHESVQSWLTEIFLKRVSQGHTLIRDPDGRFRPGAKAPNMQTMDGRVVAFTPEARIQLAQEERDQGRSHLALVQWDRTTRTLDLSTPGARVQLLTWLIRRFFDQPKAATGPFDERSLRSLMDDLVRLADNDSLKKLILQRAFDALWTERP